MSDQLRLFTGIELPVAIRHSIQNCLGHVPGIRWQSFHQLHLTVNFIGSVEKSAAESVQAAVRATAFTPFNLTITGAGHFKHRAIWLGVKPEAPLSALHQQDRDQLAALGLDMEERRYRPHVTIARIPRMAKSVNRDSIGRCVEELQAFSAPPFEVNHLSLFASTPSANGSRYEVIARSGG
ncbi:RNA 2',3'-cyclic phosphodiesterase [Marinobacter zhejiangensis]|uniref:RNA 2',3'-cyclic phosphodiesterase n=1 Tax=Marinobacter zhejiangensis TaxID=488535 RepID=A0A1I4QC17_9GAMM|nr:RNA 2',3'-cyclic phosphodiesterase [Marinobacter zhejiangensis]SFM37608.1 2'-5' RNA ligase [Marinobacter zhejiangensis]